MMPAKIAVCGMHMPALEKWDQAEEYDQKHYAEYFLQMEYFVANMEYSFATQLTFVDQASGSLSAAGHGLIQLSFWIRIS